MDIKSYNNKASNKTTKSEKHQNYFLMSDMLSDFNCSQCLEYLRKIIRLNFKQTDKKN
jgi:hypothetical protein